MSLDQHDMEWLGEQFDGIREEMRETVNRLEDACKKRKADTDQDIANLYECSTDLKQRQSRTEETVDFLKKFAWIIITVAVGGMLTGGAALAQYGG